LATPAEPRVYEARPTFSWKPARDRSGTGIKGYWVSIDSTEDWTWVEGTTRRGVRRGSSIDLVYWTSTSSLTEGAHVLRIKAEDHAGHMGSYASLSFQVELGRPDFVVSDLYCRPINPKVGDDLTISVTVKNQGDAPGKGSLMVSVNSPMREPQKTLRFAILPVDLEPDTEKVFTIPWSAEEMQAEFRWSLEPGEHQIIASIEARGLPPEANMANNEKTIPVIISAPPPPSKPDLEISKISYSPTAVAAGTELKLIIEIANTGNANAANIPWIVDPRWYASKQSTKDGVISSLAAGQAQTITLIYELRPDYSGYGAFEVWIDPENLIAEKNEDNNREEISFNIHSGG
jgi:subtilase family serine protease